MGNAENLVSGWNSVLTIVFPKKITVMPLLILNLILTKCPIQKNEGTYDMMTIVTGN